MLLCAAVIARITSMGYRITLGGPSGDIESSLVGSTDMTVTRPFTTGGAYNPPAYPSASDPNQIAKRTEWVRYVRITNCANCYLHFKEFMVRHCV